MIPWLNFLSLIPATTVTLLLISIAFLRFYNEQDFTFLGLIANPRVLKQPTHCDGPRGCGSPMPGRCPSLRHKHLVFP
jgi:hypothetical protein